jgi:hypothetical protein
MNDWSLALPALLAALAPMPLLVRPMQKTMFSA